MAGDARSGGRETSLGNLVNSARFCDQKIRPERLAHHQTNPDPADRAMRQRSLRRGKLDDAERKGGHGREGMKGDGGSGIEQRRKTHDECPPAFDLIPTSEDVLGQYIDVNNVNIDVRRSRAGTPSKIGLRHYFG